MATPTADERVYGPLPDPPLTPNPVSAVVESPSVDESETED